MASSSDSAGDPVAAESAKAAFMRMTLAGLPQLRFVASRDIAAFLRRDVIRAGLDPLDVREWMASVGGYEGETYLRSSRTTTTRRECRTPVNPESYFAVPARALHPPVAE